VLVLLNSGENAGKFNSLSLPAGTWKKVGDNKAVSLKGVNGKSLKGGEKPFDLELSAKSIGIWIHE
jgi:hypothetical protein